MSFRFRIKHVRKFQSMDFTVIEGLLEEGVIITPCTGVLEGAEGITIIIQNIALVDSLNEPSNYLTLSINDPDVAYDQLVDRTLIASREKNGVGYRI